MPAIVDREAALARLLDANTSGELASGSTGRGFRCRGHWPRVCGGITSLLRQCFKAGVRREIRVIRLPRADMRMMVSNRRTGVRVHRSVSAAFDRAAPRAPPTDTFARVCVQAAREFAASRHLITVGTELVVVHDRFPLATRIDALFRDTTSDELVLVSWKTGVGARNECEFHRHRMQLAFEWHALATTHRIRIARAYLVYLGGVLVPRSRDAVAVFGEHVVTRTDARELYAEFDKKLAKRFA